MSLQDKLMDDLKAAMRQRDELRVSVIRMIRSAIRYEEVAVGHTLEDAEVLRVIQKDVKQHRESIAEFARGNRPDLVARSEAELQILLGYLPQQMDKDAIAVEARQVIAEVGAAGAGDIGKVMPVLINRLRGKADGRLINQVVRELLSSS